MVYKVEFPGNYFLYKVFLIFYLQDQRNVVFPSWDRSNKAYEALIEIMTKLSLTSMILAFIHLSEIIKPTNKQTFLMHGFENDKKMLLENHIICIFLQAMACSRVHSILFWMSDPKNITANVILFNKFQSHSRRQILENYHMDKHCENCFIFFI